MERAVGDDREFECRNLGACRLRPLTRFVIPPGDLVDKNRQCSDREGESIEYVPTGRVLSAKWAWWSIVEKSKISGFPYHSALESPALSTRLVIRFADDFRARVWRVSGHVDQTLTWSRGA